MSGYELCHSDSQTILKKYFCLSCLKLLKDPLQVSCGHCYCKACFNSYFENGINFFECKSCNEKVTKNNSFLDNFIKREILSLQVHCYNKEEGCNWKGEVKNLETHNSECNYLKVPCSQVGCEVKVKKFLLTEHESQCYYRIVNCDFCKYEIILNNLETHHNNDCTSFPIQCIKCDTFIQRQKLKEHQNPSFGYCTGIDGKCPFIKVGCSKFEVMHVTEKKTHMEDSVVSHLTQLLQIVHNEIVKLQTINEDKKEKETFEPSSSSLTRTEITKKVETIENKIMCHGVNIENVIKENKHLQRRLEISEEKVSRLQQQLEVQKILCNGNDIAISRMRNNLMEQEFAYYNGVLLWKITDFAQKRYNAIDGCITSYSQNFYTSQHGYKMCAIFYPNGDGIGKATHISLFFAIMKGNFDALLSWPFKQKVTLMILDQDNKEHVIDTFKPDQNDFPFQRPTRNMNIPTGCPLLLSINDLYSHAYVRDNTMFVKIIVDTNYNIF